MAMVEPLDQNTWTAAIIVLESGMYANYVKNPGDGEGAGPIATGMMKWNDEDEGFDVVAVWPDDHGFLNGAHTIQSLSPADASLGFVFFDNNLRVRANESCIADNTCYETWSYDDDAWVVYDHAAVKGGAADGADDLAVTSLEYNSHVGKYVALLAGDKGEYFLAFAGGSIAPFPKFSRSDAGVTRIIDHDTSGASCYNALMVPQLESDGGRTVRIACTFTSMWSENASDSPSWTTCLFGMKLGDGCSENVGRYEYNNLVYSVDLDELKQKL
jgi:hypothetical protein